MYEKNFHSNQLCSGYTYELSTFRAKVYAYYALEENNRAHFSPNSRVLKSYSTSENKI